ncbi:YHYH domain-containing protein [Leminorella grimontii]
MTKIIGAVLVAVVLLTSVAAFAHGGRTDKDGCHMDRKTGKRHCH